MRTPFQLSYEMKQELQGMTDALDDPTREEDRHFAFHRRQVARADRQAAGARQGHDTEADVEVPQQANDTIEQILSARAKTHGEFTTHAMISQALKTVMRTTEGWVHLSDVQKETLEMNAHKVGRILNGNPNYRDHWDDIAGYARLAADRVDQ